MDTDTTVTTEKTLFTLPDHGKEDVPMNTLDFYVWLKHNKVQNPHRIETKLQYFHEIGFDKAIHTLGSDWENDMRILNNTMDHYYRMEILKNT